MQRIMWYVTFKFLLPLQPVDFNLSRKGNRNICFSFLIGETFNGRTNCENFCGATGYELANISHRDFAESKESCTAIFTVCLSLFNVL